MYAKKLKLALFAAILVLSSLLAFGAAAEGNEAAAVKTDAEAAAELGLLLGDGSGVNDAYLGKTSTRMQAAIISLRLQGLLDEAMAYAGSENFSDAGQVGTANRAILAYLKNHPEYGWNGVGGGKFDPAAGISSRQLYKVLLEIAGFRSGTDFAYAETEAFAADKGLSQIAGVASLTNAHIATALIESLSVDTADGAKLFAALQARGVVAADAKLPDDRILLGQSAELGAYLTDQNGRALYYFTKDEQDLDACKGQCLVNWPVFYAEQLQIPGSMNPDDFSVLTRPDGTKQTTYKGYPLYYFIQDTASGDVKGQNVNEVWFVIDPETFGEAEETETKTYNVDIKQFSFGSEPLTVEAGSKVVFTNYDEMKHNAVALDGSFETPLLAQGESFTITLDKAGTYNYFCEPHKQFMTGQIIVK
ncbi:plastocyanin/azurin family copper-binding protein [Paenibacillus arenilitoris]|uniref:Cupredoxin domain-containing protein n=1 Tax=Paenibacillus arenilitoris TaxID=2772299 RepID=A0A927CK77_9BACL|nr:plastocyanin/azurin family copper-binding protein [Paenibacillus arenilitoris]MBD2868677.1 cupredoxin domain-containing protein [Paenibacillus arenilitoris]